MVVEFKASSSPGNKLPKLPTSSIVESRLKSEIKKSSPPSGGGLRKYVVQNPHSFSFVNLITSQVSFGPGT